MVRLELLQRTHGEDEAGDDALEERGGEHPPGALLIPLEPGFEVGHPSRPLRSGREVGCEVVGQLRWANPKVVHTACRVWVSARVRIGVRISSQRKGDLRNLASNGTCFLEYCKREDYQS